MTDVCTNCGKLDGGAVCGDCNGNAERELIDLIAEQAARIAELEAESRASDRITEEDERHIERMAATIATLEAERDKAVENYHFMVERAANEKLDGYREMGQRIATLEAERDALTEELEQTQAAADRSRAAAADALDNATAERDAMLAALAVWDGELRESPIGREIARELEARVPLLAAWREGGGG